jgi:hypothetical protein
MTARISSALARITPRLVWTAIAATTVWTVLGIQLWRESPEHEIWTAVLRLSSGLASILTSVLCARIAREYPRGSWMRSSWLLLSASAAASVLRFSLDAVCTAGPSAWRYLLEWRQAPSVLSLVLLVAGLLVMWRALTSLGLGFSATRGDWILLSLIVAAMPLVMWFREGLSESRSGHALVRYLQFASPVLVSALAGISVPLHRLSCQMEGGQIAKSLRCFVLFAFLRALLFLRVVPAAAALPFALGLHSVLTSTMHWLFTLAVVYRWQLTAAALDQSRTTAAAYEGVLLSR